MKISLVFDDWKAGGRSIYITEKGVRLSTCDFHSGSTFNGEITLDPQQEEELRQAIKEGYDPMFRIDILEDE